VGLIQGSREAPEKANHQAAHQEGDALDNQHGFDADAIHLPGEPQSKQLHQKAKRGSGGHCLLDP
jgi:hypothetical protein